MADMNFTPEQLRKLLAKAEQKRTRQQEALRTTETEIEAWRRMHDQLVTTSTKAK